MTRHCTSVIGVIFVIVIISQQYHLSFAQQRSVTCSQTAVKRGQAYSSALEDSQNRAHELDDSFGPVPGFVKYRRKRSDMENLHSEEFSTMRKVLEVTENNHEWGLADENEELMESKFLFSNTMDPVLSLLVYTYNNPWPSLGGLFTVSLIFTLIGSYLVNQPEFPTLLPTSPEFREPFNPLPRGVGQPPQGFQPQPGSPGGGGIPSGSTLMQAQNLLDRLGVLGLPVAVFPPYADGSFVSPRTGFRTFATIFTDTITLTDRIAQRKIYRWNRQSYGFYEPLYGVAVETFFIENEFCSDDSYAYNSCSKYDEFLIPSNQIANLRYSFISNKPTCRIT